MTTLFLDIESYSETPIKNGTYAYADGAETLLIAYANGDTPVKVWDLTQQPIMPADLKNPLADKNATVVIHNSLFDRTVLRNSIGINIPVNRIHDTMVRALSHSLPGGLEKLCEVLNVPIDKAKDKRGRELIHLFCKPRPKNSVLRRADCKTHPVQWKEFVEYARLDVEAMREVYKRLPNWNYKDFELELWRLDQIISDRGIAIDVDFIKAAIKTVTETQAKLSARTNEATGGAVQKTTQRDRLLEYISETYGVEFPDLTATMVEKAIADENLPAPLKELLIMRAQASTSSTAKYTKFLSAVSSDGRLRGMLQFNGASRTGRSSGRIVQLHNLPRPTMAADDIERGIRAIKAGCADLLYDDVMALASNAIRGSLIAAKGKKFVIADLSNIEGRIGAWYGNEKWKLKAFEAYDLGVGHDLYNLAYAGMFRIKPEDVNKDQRQIGKVAELMLQFQGGVGAFCTGANAYGIDLDDLAERAWSNIPREVIEEAKKMWEWADEKKTRYDLKEKTYIVCDSLKRLWRRQHLGIVGFWNSVTDAFMQIMDNPGKDIVKGKLKFRRDGAWARILLPSGRCLCYPSPRLDDKGFSYIGINPYSRQWGRIRTYSGKIMENIVQATARDVLMAGVYNAERVGYSVCLHVHDELICEVPDEAKYTAERLSELMTTGIEWAKGLPLAAAGFETYRYKKV